MNSCLRYFLFITIIFSFIIIKIELDKLNIINMLKFSIKNLIKEFTRIYYEYKKYRIKRSFQMV